MDYNEAWKQRNTAQARCTKNNSPDTGPACRLATQQGWAWPSKENQLAMQIAAKLTSHNIIPFTAQVTRSESRDQRGVWTRLSGLVCPDSSESGLVCPDSFYQPPVNKNLNLWCTSKCKLDMWHAFKTSDVVKVKILRPWPGHLRQRPGPL